MSLNKQLFHQLWEQYTSLAPSAAKVAALFANHQGGDTVENDHIAFRTFNDPRTGIDQLAKPFLAMGYEKKGEYEFPTKKLFARHLEHRIDDKAPKIFMSELKLEECSELIQTTAQRLIGQIPKADLEDSNVFLCGAGRLWEQPSHELYQLLRSESEYAAWLYVYGFCANHFTVNVNALKHFHSIEQVNAFLKQHGFSLNTVGGEIKGTPEQLLEQSTILADRRPMQFTDGTFDIPSCYYEFALRYPQTDGGKLYSGFIAASADKIFESTDMKLQEM